MTELHMVFVKDVKPGDYLPYLGDRVWQIDPRLPNGNVGLHTEHSGVHYYPAYEQFQNVEREDVKTSPTPEPPTPEPHGISSSSQIRAKMPNDIAEMRDIDDGQIGRDW